MIQQGIGIQLLQDFLAQGSNDNGLGALLGQLGSQKDLNMQRLMASFGSQGKPMRKWGMDGKIEDPISDGLSNLERYRQKNARLEDFNRGRELAGIDHQNQLKKAQAQGSVFDAFLQGGGLANQQTLTPTDQSFIQQNIEDPAQAQAFTSQLLKLLQG